MITLPSTGSVIIDLVITALLLIAIEILTPPYPSIFDGLTILLAKSLGFKAWMGELAALLFAGLIVFLAGSFYGATVYTAILYDVQSFLSTSTGILVTAVLGIASIAYFVWDQQQK